MAVTKLLIPLLIAVLLAAPTAGSAPSGEGWSRLESENFSFFSNMDPAAAREIGLDLERLRGALGELFPRASFDSPLPTYLYVFNDRASFAPYSLGGDEPGYFAPHAHANFAVVLGSSPSEAVPIIYRQYLHELIDDNVPQLPFWFREGLAELFSSFESDEATARMGLPIAVGLDLAAGSPLPLAEILAADSPPAGGEAMKRFASRAWGLVHYLIVEESERLEATRGFVAGLRDDPTAEVSILEALGVSDAALEQRLDDYLAREVLPSRDIALPAGVPSKAAATALGRHEALFHLGDLLIHADPESRQLAAEHFRTSRDLAPAYPFAVAGMGYATELGGDLGAARDLYLEALKELPEAFRLQFYYGDCELQILGKRRPANAAEEEALERAIAAFSKATELRPTYGEAWARLGYTYNLQGRPSPEAVAILEKAYAMLPDRSDVANNLLLGYARAGARTEAFELVETMEARQADAETVRRAREVLHQLDFQYAGALARERRLDDAVALYSRIQATTADPGMRQRAADSLAKVEAGAAPNRFSERLLEAHRALEKGDLEGGRGILEALATDARPGLQQETLTELLASLADG